MSPNESPRSVSVLLASLADERAAWQGLLNTLDEEEQTLVHGEADRLAQLNAVKLAQLQALGAQAHARHDALLADGRTADPAGMDAWLARHGQSEHQALWQQLRAMEQQAQAANQRIGSLIEMRLASTRQALNVLVHAATNRNGLYDQAGQAVAARGSQPLTAA